MGRGLCGIEGWVKAFEVGVLFLVRFIRDRYLDFSFF